MSLITGSVKQMKAQNKWGLHLLGAKYVTVPCGFILGVRVHSKFNPQFETAVISRLQPAKARRHVTGFNVSAV